MADDETQVRTCRACGRSYKYPVRKSAATRFYCEACMRLDAATRETFEHFRKEIKRLSAEVTKLTAAGSAAGSSSPRT